MAGMLEMMRERRTRRRGGSGAWWQAAVGRGGGIRLDLRLLAWIWDVAPPPVAGSALAGLGLWGSAPHGGLKLPLPCGWLAAQVPAALFPFVHCCCPLPWMGGVEWNLGPAFAGSFNDVACRCRSPL
ncbi:hypothetical protein BRADI_1g28317v3 [Brachypodium distachyon]|uniref:Uncharacterized protein n=1 Tax=Brachypodium distachyon TaxID=15368 RepID=A0A2K2DLK1_BRADI|nr:hypothetical protein BRADI_1g28317v3 [Brachypodium distachyon]